MPRCSGIKTKHKQIGAALTSRLDKTREHRIFWWDNIFLHCVYFFWVPDFFYLQIFFTRSFLYSSGSVLIRLECRMVFRVISRNSWTSSLLLFYIFYIILVLDVYKHILSYIPWTLPQVTLSLKLCSIFLYFYLFIFFFCSGYTIFLVNYIQCQIWWSSTFVCLLLSIHF